ncbi:MAG: hypothetical protein WHS46_09490 [Desulfosoma sp.]
MVMSQAVSSKCPLSLCAPDADRSCFGCCPPIRPHGYDPLNWVSSLKREFRENRDAISKNIFSSRSIVGFSCWALGYLDAKGQLIGCLLHPARNEGRDLRHLTGYEEKCAREFCLQAKHFHSLTAPTQTFWLGLAAGLCSFYYSSPRANPLFHVLLWGPIILEKIAQFALTQDLSVTEIIYAYPFLIRKELSPRGFRFLFESVITRFHDPIFWENQKIEAVVRKIHATLCTEFIGLHGTRYDSGSFYVHQLGLGEAFADYLRLVHGFRQIDPETLPIIKKKAVMALKSVWDFQP